MKETNQLSFSTNQFISVLKNAWPEPNIQFLPEDDAYYNKYLIDFCNSSPTFDFSKQDCNLICSFISKSVFSFVDIIISEGSISPIISAKTKSLLLFVEYISLYGHGPIINSFFSDLIINLLLYPQSKALCSDSVQLILDYYCNQLFLYKICIFSYRQSFISIPVSIVKEFMCLLRHNDKEKYFCFSLYPLCPIYLHSNYRFYPEECSSEELYYGITSGFFHIAKGNDTYNALIRLCDQASDDIIHNASFENPIFTFWEIANYSSEVSVMKHKNYIDRLFCH